MNPVAGPAATGSAAPHAVRRRRAAALVVLLAGAVGLVTGCSSAPEVKDYFGLRCDDTYVVVTKNPDEATTTASPDEAVAGFLRSGAAPRLPGDGYQSDAVADGLVVARHRQPDGTVDVALGAQRGDGGRWRVNGWAVCAGSGFVTT